MFVWFMENLATIIICVILSAEVALVIISMVRRKKIGISSYQPEIERLLTASINTSG